MIVEGRDVERERSGHSRVLVVVGRNERFRFMNSMPEAVPRRSAWASEYQSPHRVPCVNDTGQVDGLNRGGRLVMAIGALVEILIATSGLLSVLMIVLVATMLLRGIRALCRR